MKLSPGLARRRRPRLITVRVDNAQQTVRIVYACSNDDNSFTTAHGERNTRFQIENNLAEHTKDGKCSPCALALSSGEIAVESLRTQSLKERAA